MTTMCLIDWQLRAARGIARAKCKIMADVVVTFVDEKDEFELNTDATIRVLVRISCFA